VNKYHKPILLTGSNRCGSTWAGQVLGAHPKIRYVHEPLNVVVAKKCFQFELPRWFLNVDDWDPVKLQKHLNRVLRPPLLDANTANGRKAKRVARLLLDRMWPARFGIRTLLKDPIAIFSAPWIADTFSANVLILVRHPAAYVSSILRENWHMHDFENVFLKQPELLERFSSEDINLINVIVQTQTLKHTDRNLLIQQAATLWRLFHTIILQYKIKQGDWLFVRYEDLAGDPINQFESILQKFGLPSDGSENVRSAIQKTALVFDESQMVHDGHVKKYDSKTARNSWQKEISDREEFQIREIVEPVSHEFYCDEDWS